MRTSLGSPILKSQITNHESLLRAAFPYAVFALLALLSWNRWIEPYVDTGRELMVPWRLAQGERLYADVHFHHGPLAPYLAAAVDRIVGRSLPARTALAVLVALLHLAALERLARSVLTPWRAALATSIAVAAAVFLRPGGWLFPFSFDTAIAVAALTWALVFWVRQPPPQDGRIAFCLLAALLSRPEMGLAGIVVFGFSARQEPRRLARLAALPLVGASAAYGALSIGVPRDRLVADGWLRLIDPPEAFRNVYRAYAGLDRLPLRLAELLLSAIVLAVMATLVVAGAFAAARLARKSRAAAVTAEIIPIALLAVAAALRLRPSASLAERLSLFPPLIRVIPLALVAGALWRIFERLRGREPRGPFSGVPDAILWIAAVFGARLLLAAGYVGPYNSFFLPLPILVAAVALFAAADRAAPAAGPALPRLAFASLSVWLAFRIVSTADAYRRSAWSLVETPAGSLRLPEPVAGTTRLALADLVGRFPPDATLAGFPETGFFNYVLGRRNPLWLEQAFPGHLDADGEQRAIGLLESRPPDALLLANVLAVGEGARAFGHDYLQRLDATVRSRFGVVSIHGPGARAEARIGDPGFFVEIRVPTRTRAQE